MQTEFDAVGAGASTTQPIQAGNIKKGGYAMIKGKPCKVVDISTSKTGKHGHAKANITGIDIFTGKKYDDSCPTSHNMEEPIVSKSQLKLLDIRGVDLTLMDDSGNCDESLKWNGAETDKELQIWRDALEKGDEIMVTVISACDTSRVMGPNEK